LQSRLYSWTFSYGGILRLLRRSLFLADDILRTLEERIQGQYEKMTFFPSLTTDSTINSSWYLDSRIFVDITKLSILRHNLTPAAPFASRLCALRKCVEMAKESSAIMAKKFKDPDVGPLSPTDAHQYNQQVIRIVFPEHCQYLYSCAMFLMAMQLWNLALPLVIGLRAIGVKSAINKCCCRYLWGTIILTQDKDPIDPGAGKSTIQDVEADWNEDRETVLAYIAAEMHQDYRTWEEIWQKQVKRSSALDVSTLLDDGEMEQRSYDSASASESDPRSTSKTTEADITVRSEIETQSVVQHC